MHRLSAGSSPFLEQFLQHTVSWEMSSTVHEHLFVIQCCCGQMSGKKQCRSKGATRLTGGASGVCLATLAAPGAAKAFKATSDRPELKIHESLSSLAVTRRHKQSAGDGLIASLQRRGLAVS